MSQNNFGHNVEIYSFPPKKTCTIPEVAMGVHELQDGNVLEAVWRFQGKMWLLGERI